MNHILTLSFFCHVYFISSVIRIGFSSYKISEFQLTLSKFLFKSKLSFNFLGWNFCWKILNSSWTFLQFCKHFYFYCLLILFIWHSSYSCQYYNIVYRQNIYLFKRQFLISKLLYPMLNII